VNEIREFELQLKHSSDLVVNAQHDNNEVLTSLPCVVAYFLHATGSYTR
jgi:hypothetical protein